MTEKRSGKQRPSKGKKPKLDKETIKDLAPDKDERESPRGGSQRACFNPTAQCGTS